MADKTFNIKKQGNYFVAYDTVDKKKSYGKISIVSERCIGGTLCFDALRKHLNEYLIVNPPPKESLIDRVITEMTKDINSGDTTAICELLRFVPDKYLKGYLPE
jgi:hypothetical protein